MARLSADNHLKSLNEGTAQSRTLSDAVAIDQAELLAHVLPEMAQKRVAEIAAVNSAGILKRMRAIGQLLVEHSSGETLKFLAAHTSDTVRGWACFMLAEQSQSDNQKLLEKIKPFADDPHFAVREWAWLAVRPNLVADLDRSIALLTTWTGDESKNVRRFASEALRPRGVWSAHILELKTHPERGEPLLYPLRADSSRYVQDSVANWINDAAKSNPQWALDLCDAWRAESKTAATERIISRGLRSIT
ncbi:DNA alkylation repair enzyme [Corynebacterium mustelae]|uniref:DNA alkylation repair enzyme n=1 Tax=Corynebacterium mustelae TaxID=571915 RepID=A0A0G3GTB4_9CORY|nr:HEAT repeat domain-containing protein [Corynebacterium mustelae]AKK04416.1 DNA alkylation repair enzyme [Corynebacterium mustelae]